MSGKGHKAVDFLAGRLDAAREGDVPAVGSLREFLLGHARVKASGGDYVPWSLNGREALGFVVDTFDLVLGSHTGAILEDAVIDVCGGAQFGKTILALNIGIYLTACRWYNWGYYLPDDDLVEGIVDTKLRPDVIEQIEWLPPLLAVGVAESKTGKAVNRKGAFRVSDGTRKAFGMIRGMGKIPTSFSMDCAMEDERDDIPEKRSKFLTGRMTASNLRLRSSIGTQRVYGRGQQKAWKDGSQGVMLYEAGGRKICLEEEWPAVCRMAVDGDPKPSDPKLNHAGLFVDDSGRSWDPDPTAVYYLADPDTGAVVDRRKPIEHHRRPERIKQRHWSYRISQLGIDAVSLKGIVSRWKTAVMDPDSMVVFCCDVLGLPRNTSQGISEQVIERSQKTGEPYELGLQVPPGCAVYAGVDTGDRCWFTAREVESQAVKRVRWAERIALGDLVRRTLALCDILQPAFLAIDSRPAADEARTICWALNGMTGTEWPVIENPDSEVVQIGGVTWDGPAKRWKGIKAAVVEFTLKEGGGVEWRAGKHMQDGVTKLYPVLRASRQDSIESVVRELLTPAENVMRVVDGKVLVDPVMRLPHSRPGSPPAAGEMATHFQVGSERDDKGQYVDKCENHFLLAAAYSGLAEQVGGAVQAVKAPVEFDTVERGRGQRYAG